MVGVPPKMTVWPGNSAGSTRKLRSKDVDIDPKKKEGGSPSMEQSNGHNSGRTERRAKAYVVYLLLVTKKIDLPLAES